MSILLRIWAIFTVTIKRLIAQRWLALASLFGLVITVSLTMSIPLYTDAVYYRIFQESVQGNNRNPLEIKRPPFAFLFRYVGSFDGAIEWEKVAPVDEYFQTVVGDALGLPVNTFVRHYSTDNFRLYPVEDAAYSNIKTPLVWFKFGFISDIADHVDILEGTSPQESGNNDDLPMEVMISNALATKLGLQVGEEYVAFSPQGTDATTKPIQIGVRIAGIWKPKDVNEDFWFYNPNFLEETFLLPENSFKNRIAPYLQDEVYLAVWYYVLDGTNFNITEAGSWAARIYSIQQRANTILTGTRLDISPLEALLNYSKAVRLLTIFLYAFSIPFVGLILAFIALVAGLWVQERRNEIALTRSRGMTMAQMTGNSILEAVILGAAALGISFLTSKLLAEIITRTRSFLTLGDMPETRVIFSMPAFYYGLGIIILGLLMQLVPTISSARHTIVTYKQERARNLQKPWWQKAGLDLLLLIPTVYGFYLLQRQGSVVIVDTAVNTNPLENPLLFLVPILGIIAISLVVLRLLPPFMAGLAWLFAQTKATGLLLAARQLARSPGFYTTPLILLMITLSLAAYSASLAETLDTNLYDRTYYRVGADMKLVEFGETTIVPAIIRSPDAESGEPPTDEGPQWRFLPVGEHLKVEGVLKATRVGRFGAKALTSGGSSDVRLLGIDRVEFPQVAYWRRDFARDSLGGLMNSLAAIPNGVLVPETFLAERALRVGDVIEVQLTDRANSTSLKMVVVNTFHLFPGWYPQEGTLFVANLEYIFREMGGQYPYDVWLKTDGKHPPEETITGLRQVGFDIFGWNDARDMIFKEQVKPNRQGLFGILSVGFVASAVLTVLSFLMYALFSFRRRFVEIGVLQAIGLSPAQMGAFLAAELAFLILLGVGVGTGLGVEVSSLFIPYLQIGSDAASLIPPFQIVIAWGSIWRIYGLIVLLFIVAFSILMALLLRMRIFQAIKLGETV